MIIAIIIARMPPTNASTASVARRSRCAVAITIATSAPSMEPHSRLLYGSPAPTTSQSVWSPGPRLSAPEVQMPTTTTRITTSTGTSALAHRCGVPSSGWSSPLSVLDAGEAPGLLTPSPAAALRSAASIGPNSRLVTTVIATKNSARIG